MFHPKSMILVALALLATGCSTPQPTQASASSAAARPGAPLPPPVGSDRDAHGCIGSAGYLWCGKQNQCVRPWTLPEIPNEGPTLRERVAHHCSAQ